MESENQLLRQEIDYLKKQVDSSEASNKVLERKLSIISGYFKDSLAKMQEDEAVYKKYKVLLGVISSLNPSSSIELTSLFTSDRTPPKFDLSSANLSSSNVSMTHHTGDGTRRQNLHLDLQTVDSSNRSSSNLNISTDGHRKRERILRSAKKMRLKCETFLKRFEEVEEAERMAKLRNIEESRKQSNLSNKGNFLTVGRESPNIHNVIVSITERTSPIEKKELPKEKELAPTPLAQPTVKSTSSGQTSSCNFV